MLVNSCIREVDRIGVRGRGKSCAARPREQGRHAVSKIRRAVSMKKAVKESKRGNIAAMRKTLKTGSQRRGVDKTKSSIHGRIRHQYRVGSWGAEKNWRRRLRTPNFIEAILAREM